MNHEHPGLHTHPRGQASPAYLAQLKSTRETANRQIRRRLVVLSERAPLPILYGISAVETRLCFYEFEKGWDCDVLKADGERRLRALATHHRGMRTPSSLTMVCTIILL